VGGPLRRGVGLPLCAARLAERLGQPLLQACLLLFTLTHQLLALALQHRLLLPRVRQLSLHDEWQQRAGSEAGCQQ
jgi:hypothetical protein